MPAHSRALDPVAVARLAVLAERQGGAVTWRQALDAGVSDSQVRTRVRRGEWASPAPGVLVTAPAPPEAEHLTACAVRLLQLRRRAVVSHASAGVLHAFPYVDVPPLATVTVERARRGERGVFVAAFSSRHVTHLGGLPVLTRERTLVDLLRTLGGRGAAQALADGVLLHRCALGDVDAALEDARGWPGVAQAREAWRHADGRVESPLESRCRVWFRDAGLPEPELQVPIRVGRRFFRADFLFRAQRTVVEADGRLKYADPAVLWEEKVREDGLRDQGLEVVRATWDDGLDGGADLDRRVRAAFARSARRAA